MILLILKVIYFGLPAIVANSLPVIFAKFHWLEVLNIQIDKRINFNNQPLFGKNKTWRGFFAGIGGAILFIYFQSLLNFIFPILNKISLVDYSNPLIISLGFLLGFGVLFADLVKSFIKRRLKIESGKKWQPWDSLDASIGVVVFASLYLKLSWVNILIILILGPLIHIFGNYLGYKLKLKNVWW